MGARGRPERFSPLLGIPPGKMNETKQPLYPKASPQLVSQKIRYGPNHTSTGSGEFDPRTSCAQGRTKNTILLVRKLSLFADSPFYREFRPFCPFEARHEFFVPATLLRDWAMNLKLPICWETVPEYLNPHIHRVFCVPLALISFCLNGSLVSQLELAGRFSDFCLIV
jgi:hypothetical protein